MIDSASLIKRLLWRINLASKYYRLKHIIPNIFEGWEVSFYPHHLCHASTAWFGSGNINENILIIDGHGELETCSCYAADKIGLLQIQSSQWPNSVGSIYLCVTRFLGYEQGDEFRVMGMSAYGKPLYFDHLKECIELTLDGFKIIESKFFNVELVNNSGLERFVLKENFNELCPKVVDKNSFKECHYDLAASYNT